MLEPCPESVSRDESLPQLQVAHIGSLNLLDQHQALPQAQLQRHALQIALYTPDVQGRLLLRYLPFSFSRGNSDRLRVEEELLDPFFYGSSQIAYVDGPEFVGAFEVL